MNKNFLVILCGRVFQVLFSIFIIKISTHILEPKEMGSLYIIVLFASFITLTLFNPFGMYINRSLNNWLDQKRLFVYLLYFLALIAVLSFFGIVFSALYINMVSNPINFSLEYFYIILFFYSFFIYLNPFILYILNMLHYRIHFIVLSILTSIFTLLFGYICVSMYGYSAYNWVIGITISNFLFMIIAFFVLKKKIDTNRVAQFNIFKKITAKKIKSILIFTIPLSIATLFMWLQNSGYRLLVEKNIGLEFLGFFGVGMVISSQIASSFESVLMQYFHPIYYKQISNTSQSKRKEAIEILINNTLPIYLMLSFFLTFIAKYIIVILVDSQYYKAYIFTIYGIWIEFFRMSTNLFGNISQSEVNTKRYMLCYVISSLFTIFLVYYATKSKYFDIFLPLSLAVGGFITMILMYISMQKLIKFKINFKIIFWSIFISFPYSCVYFFNFEPTLQTSLLLVFIAGVYFLVSLYFLYKKGAFCGYS